jgi:hypothetical protein
MDCPDWRSCPARQQGQGLQTTWEVCANLPDISLHYRFAQVRKAFCEFPTSIVKEPPMVQSGMPVALLVASHEQP